MPQCLVTNKQVFSSPLTESVLTHQLNLSMKYGCRAKIKFNKERQITWGKDGCSTKEKFNKKQTNI